MKHVAHIYWDRGESADRPIMSGDVLTWEPYYPNSAPLAHPAFFDAHDTDTGWRVDYIARTSADAAERGYDALSHLASWGIRGRVVVERVA